MRFTFVSAALLALAYSLLPGVYGAPAVAFDHTNSLMVRQDPASVLTALVGSIVNTIQGLLGNVALTPSQLAEQLAQIVQDIQSSAAIGVLPRAPSSSDSTPLAPSTFLSTPTTVSLVSAIATDQMGASTTSSVSTVSLSTSQVSSTPGIRMRRQLPLALPTSALSAALGIVGSQSPSLPVPSVAPSSSVPSQSAPSVSTTRV